MRREGEREGRGFRGSPRTSRRALDAPGDWLGGLENRRIGIILLSGVGRRVSPTPPFLDHELNPDSECPARPGSFHF